MNTVVQELQERGFFFEKTIGLDGQKLHKDEKGFFTLDEMDEVPKKYYEKEEYVSIKINESILERMQENLRGIYMVRGIKPEDDINETDIEVRELAKKWQKRNKHRGTYATIPRNVISAIIHQIQNKHKPNQTFAIIQVLTFAMMADDLFTFSKNSFTSKIDVDDKTYQNYWDGEVEQTNKKSNAVDEFLKAGQKEFQSEPINRDQTNPLELMIAVTTCVMNDNPKFSEALQSPIEKAFKAFYAWGNRDNEYFRTTAMDELLSEDLELQYGNS